MALRTSITPDVSDRAAALNEPAASADGVQPRAPRVCIVSLAAYNVLSPSDALTHIGGAEVQIVSIARALVDRGIDVSLVTYDHGQPDGAVHDGIRVFKAFDPGAGLPIVRFVWPRWTSVWSALGRANPEVCMQAGADSWTGIAASWCRRSGRRFIFVSMSDGDARPELPFLRTRRDRVLYRYGLRRADMVIAQTVRQQALFRDNYARDSQVILPCSTVGVESCVGDRNAPRREVVWIGRYSPEKRMAWLLDIAEQCRDVTFHIVGQANAASDYAKQQSERIRRLPNVIAHGFVPHNAMAALYRRCGLLLSTSQVEGFPTIFLEAWALGLPVVSSFDPDGTIAANGIGRTGGTADALARGIRELLDDANAWQAASRQAVRHFVNHHAPAAAAEAYSAVIRANHRKT